MALNVISLTDLLRVSKEEDIKELLFSFVTLRSQDSLGAQDVEYFLHNKAIQFEKMDLARTYLVMSSYKNRPILAGYFALANKPLTIPNKHFNKLSSGLRKRLMGFGHKTQQNNFVIQGFLLGQLGKNYSAEAIAARCLSGDELLQLAFKKVVEAYRVVGGRILYLECENVPKIIEFYNRNGFTLIEGFTSENGYYMMVKRISDLID